MAIHRNNLRIDWELLDRLLVNGKTENQITITTRHSSKGLEFEVVVMMGMDEEHLEV